MTRIERRHKLYLEERLKDLTLSERVRGSLRAQLQSLRETVRARQQNRDTAKVQSQTPPPQRTDFSTENDFEMARELHRLTLTEKAAMKKLDSERTPLSGRQNAERELRQIAKRRKALQPIPVKEIVHIETSVYLASLEDEELLNQRNVAACFAECFPDDKNTFLTGQHEIETELERRNIDWRFWLSGGVMHLYPHRKPADKLAELLKRNRQVKEAQEAQRETPNAEQS